MARGFRVLLLGAVPALLLSFGVRARAEGSNAALAESLFQEGKRLMSEHKFDAACPKFGESYKLDPASGTLLNLAACEEAQGKIATAWAHYTDALSVARRDGSDARAGYAEERIRALEPKLIRLSIVVPPEAATPGLEVRLDGTLLSAAAFGVAAPVDPGAHVVEARAPGKLAARVEVRADVPGSSNRAVVPALVDQPVTAEAPPPAAAPSPTPVLMPVSGGMSGAVSDSAGSGQAQRAVGYVALGLGAVGVGVGVVFNLIARSENQKALDTCTAGPQGNQCVDDFDLSNHDSHVTAANSDRAVSYVTLGVGAAALITGGALLLTAPHRAAPRAGQLVPWVDARSLGLGYSRTF